MRRQIVLDTESTGMNRFGARHEGHALVEIGAIEVVNRRLGESKFHTYVRPGRPVDPAAIEVHGITDEFLLDKPTFAQIAADFLAFIRGAELIIHNAPFDIGFIEYEYRKLGGEGIKLSEICSVVDTLVLARRLFPGKRNSLDALCQRYQINNSQRKLHGALLDAEILAEVYFAMTSGQSSLQFTQETQRGEGRDQLPRIVRTGMDGGVNLRVIYATAEEERAHEECLAISRSRGAVPLWPS